MSPDAPAAGGAEPTGELILHPGFEAEDVRYIRDVETLRAISDVTRMRMLEAMVQRRVPAWSVKELAAAIGMPQTRLYHHVELLLERDLIRAVERRVVSGIIETRYNVVATSFQLDRALFTGDTEESLAILHDTLIAVFDTARAEVELAIRLGVIDTAADAPADRRLLLTRGLARLTPDRSAEFRDRLQALYEEFGDDASPTAPDAPGPDAGLQTFGIVLALYPMPPTQEPHDV